MSKITAVARAQKSPTSDPEVAVLNFYPAYDDPKNAEWAHYTPSLVLTMSVKSEVAEQIEAGAEYLITFEKRD